MDTQHIQRLLNQIYVIPRQVLSNNIDLEHCPHCGRFDITDQLCRVCDKRSDCFWLVKNDEYSSQSPKPLWQQKIALDYAIDYVSVKVDEWQHNETKCKCHICEWLRQAVDVSIKLNVTIKLLNY